MPPNSDVTQKRGKAMKFNSIDCRMSAQHRNRLFAQPRYASQQALPGVTQ
jgi:hypothetical protein